MKLLPRRGVRPPLSNAAQIEGGHRRSSFRRCCQQVEKQLQEVHAVKKQKHIGVGGNMFG
jgi:hypothetical protein